MRIPLATDLKTRVGDTTKDARLKNAYVAVRGDQRVVRKRPCAQGGVPVGTGTAQGGYGTVLFWSDTATVITSNTGTTWDSGTSYSIGDHVSVDFVDYWAVSANSNSQPPSSNWSRSYVSPVASVFNYASWNPFDKQFGAVLSNGNLTITTANSTFNQGMGRATKSKSSGKWYWEVTVASYGTLDNAVVSLGVAGDLAENTNGLGFDAYGWARYLPYVASTSQGKYHAGIVGNYGTVANNGDVFGFALNMDDGELTVYKNGVSEGIMYTGITGIAYPAYGFESVYTGSTFDLTANFGATAFTYSVASGDSSGFYSLQSQ